jgi:hypothetical protein
MRIKQYFLPKWNSRFFLNSFVQYILLLLIDCTLYIPTMTKNYKFIDFVQLVRKDMDVQEINEHERLSNITPGHKFK